MNIKWNPIINSDFPDPDIIRVEDTYYMASTTMYYMPGCDILRSYDLLNWEFVSHAYDTLAENPAHNMENGQQIFGKGMWAPSFRFHKGVFYITFTSNDLQETFLLTATNPAGPWKKRTIQGFYYDNGLFFDEDDRVYIVHGQETLHLTELDENLRGPKEDGVDRIIAEDEKEIPWGYEGSHLYKRNGKYYLFTCHFNGKDKGWKTQDCFVSDSLTGEFKGYCMINDNMRYRNYGVAQGGIVDTPCGEWYAFMFQDRGALGRTPILMPIHFEEDFPVIGGLADTEHPEINSNVHQVPQAVAVKSTRPNYEYQPLNGDDDFIYEPNEAGKIAFHLYWQFSHNPQLKNLSVTERKGALRLYSGSISPNLVLAPNTLTQRCMGTSSAASILLDGAGMKDGDYAGISLYMSCYGAIALTKEKENYFLVMLGKEAKDGSIYGETDYEAPGKEYARIPVQGSVITLKAVANFEGETDEGQFFYRNRGKWQQLGITQKLYFKMDFFTGCRFGLFYFSTRRIGGAVDFMKFRYRHE